MAATEHAGHLSIGGGEISVTLPPLLLGFLLLSATGSVPASSS